MQTFIYTLCKYLYTPCLPEKYIHAIYKYIRQKILYTVICTHITNE